MTVDVSAMKPPRGAARLRASAWDYLVIVGWLAILTVLGFAVRPLLPTMTAPSIVATDALGFAVSVLPVWVYLGVTEGRIRQASWGKRRARLRVIAPDGARAGWGRVILRNGVKLLPWQLAHIAVARLMLEIDAPVTIAVSYALSLLIPLLSIGMAWRDPQRRALHDRVAGTRVIVRP